MHLRPFARCALVLTLATSAPAAWAQALVYKPVNPTFGGGSFISYHLLGVAGAQNPYKEDTAPYASLEWIDAGRPVSCVHSRSAIRHRGKRYPFRHSHPPITVFSPQRCSPYIPSQAGA